MAIGDPYISVEQLKDALEITSNEEDAWLDRCVRAASRAIEKRSGWPSFWETPTAESRVVPTMGKLLPVRGTTFSYMKLLLRAGISRPDALVVGTYVSTSVALMPEDCFDDSCPADAIRLPWNATFGTTGTLDITAYWGWPQVPADIEWAAQMQANRLYRRKGSPEGVAGSAEWGMTRIPALDPDVLSILKGGGYMRAGIG